MRILRNAGDIFELPKHHMEAVCITTNGIVKKNGCAVMGAGIAKQASIRFHGLARNLGDRLTQYGNQVYNMGLYKDDITEKWTRLIETSAMQLVDICNGRGITTCYLPCPGCSNGGLDWETQVRPLLEPILDDRFIIADYQL